MGTIREFLESTKDQKFGVSAYVMYGDGEIYVRRSWRVLDAWAQPCLDIARIHRESRAWNVVMNPAVESTGYMRTLMDEVESLAKEYEISVYIESVMNEFLPAWFQRQGYTLLEHSVPPCVYKLHRDL